MAARRQLLGAVLAVLVLLGIPKAAAQAEPKLLAEDPSDESTPSLDVVKIEGIAGTDAFQVRLGLAGSPYEWLRPEHLATTGWVTEMVYTVSFELRRQGADPSNESLVATLRAHRAEGAKTDVLGPGAWFIYGAVWKFGATIRAGPHGSAAEESTSLPYTASLHDNVLTWTVDRAAAFANHSILSPDEEWVLSRPFANAEWREPLASTVVSFLTRADVSTLAADRAPDTLYGASMVLPARQEHDESRTSGSPKDPPQGGDQPARPLFRGMGGRGGDVSIPSEALAIAGSAPVLLLGLLLALRPRPLALVLVWLFSRIDTHDALDHPRRSMIMDFVRVHPGASFARLRSHLRLGSGSLSYHLAVLERHELLHSATQDGRRHYYVPGQRRPDDELSSSFRNVLRLVQANPGMTAAELAAATGLTRTAILYHLKRHEENGAVRSQKVRRTKVFCPA